MKTKFYIVLLFTFSLCSCELITIGGKTYSRTPRLPDIDRNTADGVVCLFFAELDAGNIPSATDLLVSSKGEVYSAVQRYDLYEDINRIARIYKNKPITAIKILKSDNDELQSSYITLEHNYAYQKFMTTKNINDFWYISNFLDDYDNPKQNNNLQQP